MRLITADEVRNGLPMVVCIDAMERCQIAVSRGEVTIPPRSFIPLPDSVGQFGVKPGICMALGYYGAKLISLYPGNPAQGRPAVQGVVTLFSQSTGEPVAAIEAGSLTAIRTAAASAMASRHLARPDASTLGLLGSGELAKAHLEAICCVRDIREVVIWGRSPSKVEAFMRSQSGSPRPFMRAGTAAEAAACDIVCTVTGAATPILEGRWLKPGAHVNLVGAYSASTREADSEAVVRSRVFVETMPAALVEAGDLRIPMDEGRIGPMHLLAEIGEVAAGEAAGRQGSTEITMYKSLGNIGQDLFASEALLRGLSPPI